MVPRLSLLPSTLVVLMVAVALVRDASAMTRKYYIAANEVDWSYSGGYTQNLLDGNDQQTADYYLVKGKDRIGNTYKKVVYKEFTDSTFTKEVKKPCSMGLLGPLIRAEVNDLVEIIYFNNASREYSMHPHGVSYKKNYEGAIYVDGTSGKVKDDDVVFPGQKVKLIWNVTESDAPGPSDPNCIPWVYHSHVDTVKDTSSGAIGVFVTCRPGTLDANNKRKDVDKEYPLMVKIWDENLSWYLSENVGKCQDPATCKKLSDEEDGAFVESNWMAAINGFMYGHLPGITACVGKKVAFYIIGLGNEFDIHSLHFHGQNLKYKHSRGDTVSVFSASFVAAEMTANVAGYWQITDMVGNNRKHGMGAYMLIKDCSRSSFLNLFNSAPQQLQNTNGTVREYFLAAEKITWDYGPGGKDARTGKNLTTCKTAAKKFFKNRSDRIGGVYYKATFAHYNDSSYTHYSKRCGKMKHLGLMGPVLRAEAGDTLKVTLRNNVSFPVSLLPHGLQYLPSEEQVGEGGKIMPGQSHTYMFQVPEDLFDNTTEPCINYIYSSGYDTENDQDTGLIGPILICRKGWMASTDPKPKERYLLFKTFDENKSHYLKENMKDFITKNGTRKPDTEDEWFIISNQMFTINGYTFGNVPYIKACVGEETIWYVMSLGATHDVHTASFDGNTFTYKGTTRDTMPLVPGATAALRMMVDNPGRWIYESHSNLAKHNGMYGFYNAMVCKGRSPSPAPPAAPRKVREWYIGADEVEWDYAPKERSIITNGDLNDPRAAAHIFVRDDDDFIGDVYKKAIFRAYTDGNFTQHRRRCGKSRHMDILGPALRAEVGDVIKVHFKNLASRNYSMHAHGVRYTEADSGVNYVADQEVRPGETKTYTWEIPERSGPGPNDPNCIPWMYSSAVDPVKDTTAGLVGVVIICKPGILKPGGMRSDVNREFVVLMSVMNENISPYIADNVKNHAPNRMGTDYKDDPDFEESNIMHAINGRLHGNSQAMNIKYNHSVAWYFAALGTDVDLHSFHLHGHTVLHSSAGHRDDALNIFPGQVESMEMIADNPGTWLLHCNSLDHISAGMQTTYSVLEPPPPAPEPSPSKTK